MESENPLYLRVIGHGEITDLEAHCFGDWHLQLTRGVTFNPSRAHLQCYLSKQQAPMTCMLIKIFGLNQFVLVLPQDNPLSAELMALFVPGTLYLCLFSNSPFKFIICGVPKRSGNRLQSHLSLGIRGNWKQRNFHKYRDIFGNFEYQAVTKTTDCYLQWIPL